MIFIRLSSVLDEQEQAAKLIHIIACMCIKTGGCSSKSDNRLEIPKTQRLASFSYLDTGREQVAVCETLGVEVREGTAKLGCPSDDWNDGIRPKVFFDGAKGAMLGEDVVFRCRELADEVWVQKNRSRIQIRSLLPLSNRANAKRGACTWIVQVGGFRLTNKFLVRRLRFPPRVYF
jgi:hypothetical protein